MARSVEILITGDETRMGASLVHAASDAALSLGLKVLVTDKFKGGRDWLCVWGVGHEQRNAARNQQIKDGGHVACWDLGYLRQLAHVRVSVDHNHPWRLFDKTPSDGPRLDALSVTLRNDYDPKGPILVIGMGPKSKAHLGLFDWEENALSAARIRFPNNRVVFRPKLRAKEQAQPIVEALKGASLVICRHSNVAVDACIAGVPVECEDGAARWLYRDGPNPSIDRRLDFMRRLAWWQWTVNEQREAWTFLQMVCA